MNADLERIAERRRLLVSQAAAQRFVLGQEMALWKPRLAVADRGIAIFRYVGRYPVLIAGAGLAVALLRPRFSMIWLQRGILAWQIVSRLRGVRRIRKPGSGG